MFGRRPPISALSSPTCRPGRNRRRPNSRGGIESFAAVAPGRAQELISSLPEKLTEVQAAAQSLSPDAVKDTIEAYSQLAVLIYGNLADRGDKTWSKVRETVMPLGMVVDAAAAKARPAAAPAKAPVTKASAAKAPAAAAPAAKSATPKVPAARTFPKAAAVTVPAARAPRAQTKPMAVGVVAPKARAPRAAAPKTTTEKPGAFKAAPKIATKPAARKRAVKAAGLGAETPIVVTPIDEV